jgi:hypothetical protein
MKSKEERDKQGNKVKRTFVFVCAASNGLEALCEHGRECTHYHHYTRPSTQAIILAIYPVKNGLKTRVLTRTSVTGMVVDGKFNGYGRAQWRDGSTYMGDWENDKKHGFGV